jgi:hypothetical protein
MIKNNDKNYLLYDTEDQNQLLATAKNKEEILEESLNFTGGTWFEYDLVKDNQLINEKLYKGKGYNFTKEIKIEKERETNNWLKNAGDLRS